MTIENEKLKAERELRFAPFENEMRRRHPREQWHQFQDADGLKRISVNRRRPFDHLVLIESKPRLPQKSNAQVWSLEVFSEARRQSGLMIIGNGQTHEKAYWWLGGARFGPVRAKNGNAHEAVVTAVCDALTAMYRCAAGDGECARCARPDKHDRAG